MKASKYTYPMTREVKTVQGSSVRNKAVTVRREQISPIPGVYEDGFEVISAHECFTGSGWVSIVNREEAYTEEAAIKMAREFVANLTDR